MAIQSLSKTLSESRSLRQVAAQIKNVALFYAPKKTGRLKRALNTANRPENMIKVGSGGKPSITIQFNVAPPGAEYGKFWNEPNISPTVEKGKTSNVPRSLNFGTKGFEDPSIQKEWEGVLKEIGKKIAQDFIKELKV